MFLPRVAGFFWAGVLRVVTLHSQPAEERDQEVLTLEPLRRLLKIPASEVSGGSVNALTIR